MKVNIGADDASAIRILLAQIGQEATTTSSIKRAAESWSRDIDVDMEASDLLTVAWLLRDASAACHQLMLSRRDHARYWSAFLENRLQRSG
jgi:hypothetical protein